MQHDIIRREEMLSATLELGGAPISLAAYATTGLFAGAIAPRGGCKTNAGLLIAEQLSEQGWVSVLVDPERELSSLYGPAVPSAESLHERLVARDQRIVVVDAPSAAAFIPYGRAILEAADSQRKPVLVMLDEGQMFSTSRRVKNDDLVEAAGIVNDFAERGRKRALDVFVTSHRYTGTLSRSLFANMNLMLLGRQEDPTAWSALAPRFRAAHIEFGDLAALVPGEFMCSSRYGIAKIKMPMAAALKKVAVKAKPVRPELPANYQQWDRAMRNIPTERLEALTSPVITLLGALAGLTSQQLCAGSTALQDELATR